MDGPAEECGVIGYVPEEERGLVGGVGRALLGPEMRRHGKTNRGAQLI